MALVAIAAGGTAGHVNPALALAEELTRRGEDVLFFGQEAKLEGRLVPEAGFELVPLTIRGFDRSKPWTAVSAATKLMKAKKAVRKAIDERPPAVAVGFGAYVEVPLLSECDRAGIPTLIHEQNSVVGLANRMMAKRAYEVCISFPQAKEGFEGSLGPHTKLVFTGNPVRRSVIEGNGARAREGRGIPADAEVLVCFGGSLGAVAINDALVGLKERLLSLPNLHVIHATGAEGYDATAAALTLTPEEEARWHLSAYVDDMGDVLAASDLALCRAGASSVAELAAVALPAILVPYPHATADHQRVNAAWLADAGAARIVDNDDLAKEAFANELVELLEDAPERKEMAKAAASLGSAKAASLLADEVLAAAADAAPRLH